MNLARVAFILGSFCGFISAMLVVPAILAVVLGEFWTLPAYLGPLGMGVLLMVLARRRFADAKRTIFRREGLLVVTGSWLIAAILGALPFLLTGALSNPVDAIFETMSGFTTTGSTVLVDIEICPKSLLFWRAMTQWLGGMGIVVLFVAVLPALGAGGRLLYEFEVPGVDQESLHPRIRDTAMVLWKIYLLLTLVEVAGLLILGLDLYDALTHTFTTVSTGGFSPYNASIAQFNAPSVEVLLTVVMFLAGANFSLYFRAYKHGPRVLWKDTEFRVYAVVMVGASLFTAAALVFHDHYGILLALRHGFFNVVSIGTTTGFGTEDFNLWPDVVRMLLVLLMFLGGCAGSTAGGIKVLRMILVVRFLHHELRRFIRPHRVRTLTVGGQPVPLETMRNTLAFFCIVVLIFIGSSFVLVGAGLDFTTAMSSVAATFGNIGPGLGLVGPKTNFAELGSGVKLLLTALMLLGRLELFTALALLLPSTYRD